MLTLLSLELRKLLGSRSARLGLLVTFLLPFVWAFAPRLDRLISVNLTSAWQLPAVSLGATIPFLLPLFVAITVAELVGAEVGQGTLAPLLLRPVSRMRILASKLIVSLGYPFLLILSTVLGSLLAGLPLGYSEFLGGVGMGTAAGGFVGVGVLGGGAAALEVTRGAVLAALSLLPIATLALLFSVLFLNTAAAALATFAGLLLMRLLVVLPEAFEKVLLTSHLGVYYTQTNIAQSVVLLLIYTLGFGIMAVIAFDRRDV